MFQFLNFNHYLISDNVAAVYDLWLIGDDFLRDNIRKFFSIKRAAKKKGCDIPYLFNNYNIAGWWLNLAARGILRLINPLVEALNECCRLPKFIVFIPDKDLIINMEANNFCAEWVMGAILHYMIKQIDLYIECRKQDLMDKRIGALVEDHPKIVWIRMLKRPQHLTSESAVYSLCGKFNSILEERLLDSKHDNHYIISILIPDDQFDPQGNLLSASKSTFWKEFNRDMKKFDNGEITLNPRQFQASSNAQRNEAIDNPRKLPTPPPATKDYGSTKN